MNEVTILASNEVVEQLEASERLPQDIDPDTLRKYLTLARPDLEQVNIRFTDAQVERIWAIVSAHQAGLSIRKIAGATGLSSSRIHQLLNAPEAKEIPVWSGLSQLRQSSRGSGGKKKAEQPEPETEIRSPRPSQSSNFREFPHATRPAVYFRRKSYVIFRSQSPL